MRTFLILCLASLLLASSCGGNNQEEILVFAAASLTDVMTPLGERFHGEEGIRVNFNFGGSTELAGQIIRGAPADAFISAGSKPLDTLEDRGLLVPDTRAELMANELVLAGRVGRAKVIGIGSVEDLANADARVAIASPDLAPAGKYAEEALRNLGLWRQLQPRLVFGLNVRFALGYVETGNVDVGIVYRTDTMVSENLEVIASIPKDSHKPIVYPAGIVKRSDHVGAARKFLLYLESSESRETFRRFGFSLDE